MKHTPENNAIELLKYWLEVFSVYLSYTPTTSTSAISFKDQIKPTLLPGGRRLRRAHDAMTFGKS